MNPVTVYVQTAEGFRSVTLRRGGNPLLVGDVPNGALIEFVVQTGEVIRIVVDGHSAPAKRRRDAASAVAAASASARRHKLQRRAKR
jgi:hypothetical protein